MVLLIISALLSPPGLMSARRLVRGIRFPFCFLRTGVILISSIMIEVSPFLATSLRTRRGRGGPRRGQQELELWSLRTILIAGRTMLASSVTTGSAM